VHPLPAPQLRDQRPVDRHEELRVPAGGEIAEDRAVEPELRLGDEVQEVVREIVAVPGPAHPQVRRLVPLDIDAVPVVLLREGDLHG
jgi:hypothetical protein